MFLSLFVFQPLLTQQNLLIRDLHLSSSKSFTFLLAERKVFLVLVTMGKKENKGFWGQRLLITIPKSLSHFSSHTPKNTASKQTRPGAKPWSSLKQVFSINNNSPRIHYYWRTISSPQKTPKLYLRQQFPLEAPLFLIYVWFFVSSKLLFLP